jgi:hypothetical protein
VRYRLAEGEVVAMDISGEMSTDNSDGVTPVTAE